VANGQAVSKAITARRRIFCPQLTGICTVSTNLNHLNCTVAVLQKNSDERQKLLNALNDAGYLTWCSEKIQNLVAQMHRCEFAVVIIDSDLLDSGQLETLASRFDAVKASLVVISSDNSLSTELKAHRAGSRMFFRKPLVLDHVIEAISYLCSADSTQQASTWVLNKVASTLESPDGIQIHLSPGELVFLDILSRKPMEVVPNFELLTQMFVEPNAESEHRLAMLLSRLRLKFKNHGLASPVRSVFGRGRVFSADLQQVGFTSGHLRKKGVRKPFFNPGPNFSYTEQ
jgi:DNA-binding response OmpR family regulator